MLFYKCVRLFIDIIKYISVFQCPLTVSNIYIKLNIVFMIGCPWSRPMEYNNVPKHHRPGSNTVSSEQSDPPISIKDV